jgi:hypothetical protein
MTDYNIPPDAGRPLTEAEERAFNAGYDTAHHDALAVAAHNLMRAILAWECFKDPMLSELVETLRRSFPFDETGRTT